MSCPINKYQLTHFADPFCRHVQSTHQSYKKDEAQNFRSYVKEGKVHPKRGQVKDPSKFLSGVRQVTALLHCLWWRHYQLSAMK